MGICNLKPLLCGKFTCMLVGIVCIWLPLRGSGGNSISKYWWQSWIHKNHFAFTCPKPHTLKQMKYVWSQSHLVAGREWVPQKHLEPHYEAPILRWLTTEMEEGHLWSGLVLFHMWLKCSLESALYKCTCPCFILGTPGLPKRVSFGQGIYWGASGDRKKWQCRLFTASGCRVQRKGVVI